MSTPRLAPPIGIGRIAMPLSPTVIRVLVPKSAMGAYCIYRDDLAVYVGRSDRCVRARLLAHAASGLGTHFTWESTPHERGAFLLESLWYHQLVETGHALNLVHPARPSADGGASCPICDEAFRDALRALLRRL